jgi:hypothetical protein
MEKVQDKLKTIEELVSELNSNGACQVADW